MKKIDLLINKIKDIYNKDARPNIVINCSCNDNNNWIVEEQRYRNENIVLVQSGHSCVPTFYKRCYQIKEICKKQEFYILSEFRKIADKNNFTFSIMPSGIYFMKDFYRPDYLEEMKNFCMEYNLIGEHEHVTN